MPSADKRARKKENARAAREQREAALKRKKRTRSSITVGIVIALFVGVIVLLNVAGGSKSKADPKLDSAKTYVATIKTNFGTIKMQLDQKQAPIAAAHFANLINKKVYDGSRWHRIVKGFVIQGGAPGGDATKAYGTQVIGELPTSPYKLGDVAAGKTPTDTKGSFDSQFFIVTGAQGEALPAEYTDFAHVTAGMSVVRKIEALPTDSGEEPTQTATIDTITLSSK